MVVEVLVASTQSVWSGHKDPTDHAHKGLSYTSSPRFENDNHRHERYPPRAGYIAFLQPDVLGEPYFAFRIPYWIILRM